ncbi:MAG: hypothetical protein R6V32_05340, partial [Bacteroidales bacterium]
VIKSPDPDNEIDGVLTVENSGRENERTVIIGDDDNESLFIVPKISESGWNPPLVKAGDIGIFFRNGLNNQNENGSGLVIAPQDNPNEPGWEYKKGIRIAPDGNVGIGTSSPDYKLDVCGTMRSKEWVVEDFSCMPDFVFDPKYELMSLDKRKKMIFENSHMPYLLSEDDMKESGVPMFQTMQGIIQYTEEIYLYLFEMDERLKELEEENQKLKENNKELMQEIKAMKNI